MTPMFIVPPVPPPELPDDELQAVSADADAIAIAGAITNHRSTIVGTPLSNEQYDRNDYDLNIFPASRPSVHGSALTWAAGYDGSCDANHAFSA
jgi:hypothetical protein